MNFAWIVMMSGQMGLDIEYIKHLYYGQWLDVFIEYKHVFNMKQEGAIYQEEESVVSMRNL